MPPEGVTENGVKADHDPDGDVLDMEGGIVNYEVVAGAKEEVSRPDSMAA